MKRSTLFIDESGLPSLLESSSDPFLITGVIVNDDDVQTIEGFFSYIKRKYKIDIGLPFHSFDMFEQDATRLTPGKAKDLIKHLADFISIIPIHLKILSIDREEFKKALGIKSNDDMKGDSKRKSLKDFPYRIMAAQLFEWFSSYLEKHDGIGQIVADARRGGDAQLIKTLYQCKERSGPFDEKRRESIERRCTAICFADKNYLSGGLEITDMVSYAAYQHAKRVMSSQFSDIELNTLWIEIKKLLPSNTLRKLSTDEIQAFFSIKKDGVHKYLNKT